MMPTQLFGTFRKMGYRIEVYMHSNPCERQEWHIEVYQGDGLIMEAVEPMCHAPNLSVHADDVARLEARIDALLEALKKQK